MKRTKQKPQFYSKPLREWAKEIQRLKDEITTLLLNPMEGRTEFHLPKWNKMNSQEKKLFVFRAIECGYIQWTIASRTSTKTIEL